jgi:hypothetical protein
MGVCVDVGHVSANIVGTISDWKTIVIDDGTALIDVLVSTEEPITMADQESWYQCGQCLDVVGSLRSVYDQSITYNSTSDRITTRCIFAHSIYVNSKPNAETLRYLEIVRTKTHCHEQSARDLCLNSGLFMAEHMIELISPFRIDESITQRQSKISIDRSRAYHFMKCADRQGLTERNLASLLGCNKPDHYRALSELLVDMQARYEIYRTKEDTYVCL